MGYTFTGTDAQKGIVEGAEMCIVGNGVEQEEQLYAICCDMPVFFLQGGKSFSIKLGDNVVSIKGCINSDIVGNNLDELDQIEITLSGMTDTRRLMYDVNDKETLIGIIQCLLAE